MRTVIASGLLAAATLSPSTSLAEDRKGIIVFGDFQSLEPTNVDHMLGVLDTRPAFFVTDPLDPLFDPELLQEVKEGERTRLALGYGRESAFRGGLGYSWGRKGRVEASVWDYSQSRADLRRVPEGLIMNDSFNSQIYGPRERGLYGFDVDGRGSIDASSIALDYVRDQEFDNWTLTFRTGLRRIEYEESLRLEVTGGDLNPEDFISALFIGGEISPDVGVDSRRLALDGVGAGAGVGGARRFGRRFSLVGDLGLAFVTGDSASVRTSRLDNPAFANEAGADTVLRPSFVSRASGDVTGLLWDASAGVRFRLLDGLDITLLATYSSWEDLATTFTDFSTTTEPFSEGDFSDETQTTPIRDNVTFGGVSVGLRWVLGGP